MEPAHQYQNGGLRVIGYASRLFNAAERSYCTTRQELTAMVFGLKRFRQYILGRKVLVRSDHAALSYLRRTKDPVAQQVRWLDFIEQFDITVRHRSGSATGQLMRCREGHVNGLVRVISATERQEPLL